MYPNNISSVDDDTSTVLNIDEIRWLAAIDSPPREATFTPTPIVATAAPSALPTRVAAKPNSTHTKPTLVKSSPSPARYTPSQGLAKSTSDLELALDPETCSLYVESQNLYAEPESYSSTPHARTPAPGHISSGPRSSPPSSYKRPTPISKLDLSTHTHPMRVQSPAPHRNRHYRLGEPSSIPIHLPFSPSLSPPTLPFGSPSSKASSIPSPSPASALSHSSHLSRSLPTSPIRRPEWIYRHPKPRNASSPFPMVSSLNTATSSSAALAFSPPSPSRTRTRSSTSRNKPRPQTGYLSRSAQSKPLPPSPKQAGPGLVSNPFWSSILRQRPRSRRSIPALRTAALSQAPASSHSALAAPPAVPPKSPSRPVYHVRTPSTSSTASTASAYSTNTTSTTTTTTSPLPLPPSASIKAATTSANAANPARTRLHSSSSSSSAGSTGTASSSTTATSSSPPHTPSSTPFPSHAPVHPLPLSSSFPSPAKSILTRSSSISTTGKHSLASGTGTHSASLLSCASKSVTFVDVPTVHYHDAGSWEIGRVEEEVYGDIAEVGEDEGGGGGDVGMFGVRKRGMDLDSDMGVDVDCMDSDLDVEGDAFGTCPKDSLQTKGLKRLVSLSRKTPPTTRPSRPTISGPFALGSLQDPPRRSTSPVRSIHSFRSASTCSPSLRSAPPSLRSTPSVRSTHSAGHTYRPTHIKAHSCSHPMKQRVPYPTSVHSLRAEPSCESLGRSVRSLGSVKSTTSTRGFRAWLAKVGAGMGLAGVGWEP